MVSKSCGCVGVLDALCQLSHHPQQEPFHRTARQHPAPRTAPLICRFNPTRQLRGAQAQKQAQITPPRHKSRRDAEESRRRAGEGGRLAAAQLPGTMDLWGAGFPVSSPNSFMT